MAKKTKKKTVKKKAKKVTPEEKPAQPVDNSFEQAVAEAEASEPKIENRGGVRAGAGRPAGLTAEKAAVKNLPKYPSIPIKQGCQSLFDLWATAAKIEQLALTDEEADLLSLPLTQLQEYYFPGILPEIAGSWIMLIFAATRIVKPRIDIIETTRKQRRQNKPKKTEVTSGGNGKLYHYMVDGKPIHAIEPGEAASFTDSRGNVNCTVCLGILNRSNG